MPESDNGTRAASRMLAALRRTTSYEAKFAAYEQLRSLGQVLRFRGGLIVLGYQECLEVIRDSERFGSAASRRVADLAADSFRGPAAELGRQLVLLQEGADHHKTRMLLRGSLADLLGEQVRSKLDEVVARAMADFAAQLTTDGGADVVTGLAEPAAVRIYALLLGVPAADVAVMVPEFRAFAKVIDEAPSTLTSREHDAARAIGEFAGTVIARSRSLLRGVERPADLVALVSPGLTNLPAAIASLIYALDGAPQAKLRMSASPELLRSGVDELLRCYPSVHAVLRIARTDLDLAGIPVGAGELILAFTAAANRDPAVWHSASSFDVGRQSGVLPQSFGFGPHSCLGAAMVRTALARVAVQLDRHLPELRVAKPPEIRPALVIPYPCQVLAEPR
jgi:cytochrome P450